MPVLRLPDAGVAVGPSAEFIVFGWMSAGVNAQAGKWDFFIPLAFRAIGISMVQLPLINQAVAGLLPKDYPAGIALNNMIRQSCLSG